MWRLNYLSDTHETLHNKMHDEDLSPVNFKFFLTIILFELYRFVMLQLRKIILYKQPQNQSEFQKTLIFFFALLLAPSLDLQYDLSEL